MTVDNPKKYVQRAIVLQGGGTPGAYEAGAIKAICKKLARSDKSKSMEMSSFYCMMIIHFQKTFTLPLTNKICELVYLKPISS